MPRWPFLRVLAVFALVCLLPLPALAAPPLHAYGSVHELVFVGNDETSEVLLRDEIGLQEGDVYSSDRLAEARQALMDLGLFRKVDASAEQLDGGVRLTFEVYEKYYLLPLPRLSRNAEGDISLGGQLRFDNLFGLNHQFKITLERERENEGRGRETDKLRFDYGVQRIVGTLWGMSARIAEDRYPVSSDDESSVRGEWSRSHTSLQLAATRKLDDLTPDNPGWIMGFGFTHAERRHQFLSGDANQPPPGGEDRTFRVSLAYDGVHEGRYRRFGRGWGGSMTLGGHLTGGDYQYSSLELFYRAFVPLDEVADNLNMSLNFGYANGNAWDLPRFSLGSSSTLRGIEGGSLEGDTMLYYKLEWLTALRRHPRFRFLGFFDVGNAWKRYTMDLSDMEATVGVGIRWKIDAFVRTDLSIDIGYHPATGEHKIYAGTSASF